MRKNLALLATVSMLVIGLSPLTDQPEARATTTTVTDGNCSIEVNDDTGVTIEEVATATSFLDVGDCLVKFTDVSVSYSVTLPSSLTFQYVVVGGGGAGGDGTNGQSIGGGGGAGEVLTGSTSGSSLTIDVGQGGEGSTSGTNSVLGITGGATFTGRGGEPGVSHGGGSNIPGGGNNGAGENGGDAFNGDVELAFYAGAGGGASGSGSDAVNWPDSSDQSGQHSGGDGIETFAGFVGGGGGAGARLYRNAVLRRDLAVSTGGQGGGGNGARELEGDPPEDGGQNTGGGGGGAANSVSGGSGGNGGSGLVALSFTTPTLVTINSACTVTGSPSGVTADDSSGSCVVEFTTPGITYDVTLPSSLTFDYLLVGGGGGGSGSGSSTNSGGGGGGGQVRTGNQSTAVTGLKVTVGDGGAAGNSSSLPGGSGDASTILPSGGSLISANPGVGAPGESSSHGGSNGGVSGQGKAGGTGHGSNSEPARSGGGGGGDQAPGSGTTIYGGTGNGGAGFSFSGFTLSTEAPTSFGGGGGGGFAANSGAGTGADGGGNGGSNAAGVNGAPNSGGGGGGGSATNAGGDGGSGFAAISFSLPFATPVLSEPTPTEDGFEVTITNYQTIQDLAVSEGGAETDVDDDDWSATADSSASASVSGDKVTVTGLTPTEDASASATVTVTLTPGGSLGAAASATKDGNTLKGQSDLSFSPTTPMDYLDSQALSVTGGDGTGSTTFTVDSDPDGNCSITGNVLSTTGVGTCDIKATKAADSVYASKESSAVTITVSKADREISFTSSVPNNPVVNDTYTPTVSITNKNDEDLTDAPDSLTASFSVNTSQTDNYDNSGSSDEVCSISSGVVSFQAEGTCQIDAVSDNSETLYASSSTISQVIEIGIANQNITFESIADKTITSAPFTISPTSSAGLTVTTQVDASSTSVCSLTGKVVQILSVGECIITATQDGIDGQFAEATPITQSFDVAPVVPGPPILESIGFDSQTINISFTPPSFLGGEAIDNYSMVATDDDGNSFANNNCGLPDPVTDPHNCSVSGLRNGTEYTTTLVAINSAGESTPATAPRITPAEKADSVGNLLLTNGDGELTASWTKPTSFGGGSFTSYDLKLSSLDTEFTHQITDVDTLTHTFTGLDNGTQYDLELVVISSANQQSLQSNTTTTTGIPATTPSVIRNAEFEEISFSQAFISFAEPESNGGLTITSYQLSSTVDLGDCSTITDTYCQLTGLPGGEITVEITAANAVGLSTPVELVLTLSAAPSSDSSPPYTGPLINEIDSPEFQTQQQSIILRGARLDTVTEVIINNLRLEILSLSDSAIQIAIPETLANGVYDLKLISSIGNLTYLDVPIGEQTISYGEQSAWTKRISDSQVKVYVKFPEIGKKLRILHQTAGAGDYRTVFVKTIAATDDEALRVVPGIGSYIVRTIDLSEINRIRIRIDDAELWSVRYNR